MELVSYSICLLYSYIILSVDGTEDTDYLSNYNVEPSPARTSNNVYMKYLNN